MLLPIESLGKCPAAATVLRKLHKLCLMHDGSYYKTVSIEERLTDLGNHLRIIWFTGKRVTVGSHTFDGCIVILATWMS